MQREFTKIGNENKASGKRTPELITYKLQRYTVPELDKQLKDNARSESLFLIIRINSFLEIVSEK